VNGVGSHAHCDFGLRVLRALAHRLPLSQFVRLQQEAICRREAALERAASTAGGAAVVDLRVYRAQIDRVRALDLYLLDVRVNRRSIHKIGVTSRAVEVRLAEIERALAGHFEDVALEVAQVWKARGCVELYFKRRFAAYRAEVARSTEYFDLARAPNERNAPLAELAALE